MARRLADAPELARARRIALYAAHGDGELPTGPLCALAEARGLVVAWPRAAGEALVLAACASCDLVRGPYGVLEPPAGAPALALEAGDVVVVPALALDAQGRRLGRGGGHYDRALAGGGIGPAPFRVGVGYDFQCVAEVPAGAGDERVDMVVTEARLIRTGARGGAR